MMHRRYRSAAKYVLEAVTQLVEVDKFLDTSNEKALKWDHYRLE
jgi:hypothetical protein